MNWVAVVWISVLMAVDIAVAIGLLLLIIRTQGGR